MILLVDNYDSFSYNLYQIIGVIDSEISVVRNDKIDLSQIEKLHPDYIIISPGPGKPKDAGISIELIKQFYKDIPILGVCLGHQCIYEAFGGIVTYSKNIVHGKSSVIDLDEKNPIFKDLSPQITAGRYHSLSADEKTLPNNLKIIAKSSDNEIMAISDKKHSVYGLQFHPESILTPVGSKIIKNFIELI